VVAGVRAEDGIAMDQVREKRVEVILQQMEALPMLPAVAVRVSGAGGSGGDAINLIQADSALAEQVLRLLDRSHLGVVADLSTLDKAVALLGLDAIGALVVAVCVFDCLENRTVDRTAAPIAGKFNRPEFWKHSLAVACGAELLALRLDSRVQKNCDPAKAFAGGLLHDIGKAALDAMLPKSYAVVVEAADVLRGDIADLERSIIGVDHMVVGKRLAERWELPMDLCQCIWLHGQQPDALPATVCNPVLINLITRADMLARERQIGYSGNYGSSAGANAIDQEAGLDEAALHWVRQRLGEHMERRAGALSVAGVTAGAARQTPCQPVGALAELSADASCRLVLQSVARSAVQALGASSAGAFSAMPGRGVAEVLLVDGHGDGIVQAVVPCPSLPPLPAGDKGLVLTAGAELEWIMSAVSPRLDGDRRYWICLGSQGRCIGGVMWGAAAREAERLDSQASALSSLSAGWTKSLRTAQIREESRLLAEHLAEANRRLHDAMDQLQRTRTIVTVGEMAAGAAHEMNNPLAVISGRSQLLAGQLTEPKFKHAAMLIYEQSHRLSQIISELMDFARPNPPQARACVVGRLVAQTLQDAGLSADRRFEVTVEDVPPVLVDAGQITAALNEVISNALQAVAAVKGRITISAAYDAHGGRVVLSVTDNGCGMDETTLKRAFDPFFSSKPAGRRRGMGLAKALRWIESSGGSIRLESRRGEGTRCIILLPAAAGPMR